MTLGALRAITWSTTTPAGDAGMPDDGQPYRCRMLVARAAPEEDLIALPEVIEARRMFGALDHILRVAAADLNTYETFTIERLLGLLRADSRSADRRRCATRADTGRRNPARAAHDEGRGPHPSTSSR